MDSSLGESCEYVFSMNEPMTGVGRNVQLMRTLFMYSQTAMLWWGAAALWLGV